MNILSIQSHVAYGHVGNAAAVFALQRLGVEVWPVHTAQLSNHRGYDTARGRDFDGVLVSEVFRGIAERGVLDSCDGVLSGYIGQAQIGDAVLDSVALVKEANPAARYCCDPVIGDAGRAYVRPEVAEFMRARAAPAADIITPNQFELEFLSGRKCGSLASACQAIDAVHALGPAIVLVTSARTDETPREALDLLASDGKERYRVRTPCLPMEFRGPGDVISALFLARYLRSGSLAEAASLAAASVFGMLERTADAGARELALIVAQDEIVAPTHKFTAERI